MLTTNNKSTLARLASPSTLFCVIAFQSLAPPVGAVMSAAAVHVSPRHWDVQPVRLAHESVKNVATSARHIRHVTRFDGIQCRLHLLQNVLEQLPNSP